MAIGIPSLSSAVNGAFARTYLIQLNSFIPQVLCVIDTVDNESPEFSADVTQHPVEAGQEVSDHIQLKAPTLSLKGKMSNTPLDLSVTLGNIAAGAAAIQTSSQARSNILSSGLSQATSLIGSSLIQGSASGSAGAAVAAGVDALNRAILLNAYEQRLPFNVVTKRQLYQNMVIEKLRFPRDNNTGYALAFEMDMVKIRIVSSLTVQLQTVSEDVSTSASQNTNLGGQTTQATSAATQSSVNSSWLLSIARAAGA